MIALVTKDENLNSNPRQAIASLVETHRSFCSHAQNTPSPQDNSCLFHTTSEALIEMVNAASATEMMAESQSSKLKQQKGHLSDTSNDLQGIDLSVSPTLLFRSISTPEQWLATGTNTSSIAIFHVE